MKKPANFESKAIAAKLRRKDEKCLQGGQKRQRRLADKLAQCRRGERCGSEACRVCKRRFRLRELKQVGAILAKMSLVRVSVIPAGMLIPLGQLHTADIGKIKNRVRKALERSAICSRTVFGGIDISLNAENNQIVGWQLHIYLLIEGQNDKVLRKAVRGIFHPDPQAAKPFEFGSVTNLGAAISYADKAMFELRSGYIKNGQHRVRGLPLKATHRHELLPFLDKLGLGGRLILRGLRRNGKHFEQV